MKKDLIMMDMVRGRSTNGVTRCLENLIDGFSRKKQYNLLWIRFTYDSGDVMENIRKEGYTLVTVPLPKDIHSFLRIGQIRNVFWEKVFNVTSSYFENNPIIHVHTLNLIEFAMLVKKHLTCKIVTHLHCIPWKGLYNTNVKLFNELYCRYYIQKEELDIRHYIRQPHEWLAYTCSDCLICVTKCGKDFVERVCPEHTKNIQVVSNGIRDKALARTYTIRQKELRCLFVGNANSSKGLHFVLSAIQALLTRIPVTLTIVGSISRETRESILSRHPYLKIRFTGNVKLEYLIKLYAESDIGIISSMQEQCSYVAIEMMMAGLPIITTDVDGLSEMFTHRKNGMKIPISFHPQLGLYPEIPDMAESIIELAYDQKLRTRIGKSARRCYSQMYTQKQMISSIETIYQSL
ncbi:MAG: glycosyltransferase family 4 protein [Bacteroidaceae bacterium]|nr:glycosyltransferase family 4 protein [Bacteroidaceae bacterium]